jgi:hypothetical protein
MTGITTTDTRERDPLLKGKLIQSVFPVAGLVFAVIFLLNVISQGFNETTAEPALFIFITLPLGVLSLALIWRPGRAAPAVSEQERAVDAVVAAATTAPPDQTAAGGASRWRRLYENDWTISFGVVAGLILLLVFIHYVGLLIGGGLFMLLLGPFLGYRNPLIGIPIIAGVMTLVWLIFEYLLEVPLPKGQWGI